MQQASPPQHLGPLKFAEGITRINVSTFFLASFICIAMLAGMNFLQSYVLTEQLNIPRGQQGQVAGMLTFWTELVAIALVIPFGILSDRIGRRPVLIFGIVTVGIGYGLYPFASSIGELMVYRLIYAVGASSCSSLVAIIANDYPQETSRGKMIGAGNVMNSLGTIFMAGVLAQMPAFLIGQGVDSVLAGQIMFLTAAGLCFAAALAFRFGLKEGTPISVKDRLPFKELIRRGLMSGKNPRIAISYAVSFTARGDLVVKAVFLSLWIVQLGREQGLSREESLAAAGLLYVIMQFSGLIWHIIFGFILDRINRVTGLVIAMAFASVGYLSMGIITSPLDYRMLPAFIILALGSSSAMQSSMSLVGQEAPKAERGAIIGTLGMFGAIGILISVSVGGYLFDVWAPYGPFVFVGAIQVVLLILTIVVRVVAPGPDVLKSHQMKPPPAVLKETQTPH